jgi:soluble lytic murein transglycosylase
LLSGLLLSVAALSAAHAELSDSDRALYRKAYMAANAGHWDQVWPLVKGASDPFPAKLLRWIELTRDTPGVQFCELKDFIEANPDWPSQILLRTHAEEALEDQSDAVAADWFARHQPVTWQAKVRRAQFAIAAGHEAEGVAELRAVWIGSEFTEGEEKNFLLHYGSHIRAEDHAKRLDRLLWDGKEAEARRMLPRVSLDIRALGDARLALATMAPDAEHLLSIVPARLQGDPGLLFERMRWRARKDKYDDAIALLEHPPADLVRPLAWAGERQVLARQALAEGNVSIAYRLAAAHGLSEGPAFGELEFFAGWVALRFLNEPRTGYEHFVRLYDRAKLSISKGRAAYWAARASTAMHLEDYAEGWYEKAVAQSATYYGQLAATALGRNGLTDMQPEPEPTPDETKTFEARELVLAARDLVTIGDPDDVKPFLTRIAEADVAASDFVQTARLSAALDRPDMILFTARRAANAGVTLFAESYPLIGLPPGGNAEPALVLAVARQESAFDPDAVSGAGARGMMQLMPATAKRIARTLELPYAASMLTDDRVYNMKLGRAYLDDMLSEFGGSYVLAIAAYNAGPSRVSQWVGELGDPRQPKTDVVEWIESVPLGETRNYLQRVLENLQIYRLRLGNRDLAFKLAVDLKR